MNIKIVKTDLDRVSKDSLLYIRPTRFEYETTLCENKLERYPYYLCSRAKHHKGDCAAHGCMDEKGEIPMFARWSRGNGKRGRPKKEGENVMLEEENNVEQEYFENREDEQEEERSYDDERVEEEKNDRSGEEDDGA
jgi:hypothetical protein